MGEIRIVGPGKIRGYPYPVCKKVHAVSFRQIIVLPTLLFNVIWSATFSNFI